MQPRMPQGFPNRAPMMMGMNQMQQPNMMFRGQQQMNRGGGLLSKILGKGTQARGMGMNGIMGTQTASRAAAGGGSLLQNLSNPAGISSFLNNTQQVIRTAQTFGPVIQQYGPIVKNIPAMWKIYRGFKNASADSDGGTKQAPDKQVESSAKSTHTKGKTSVQKTKQSSKNTLNEGLRSQTTKSAKTTVTKSKGDSVPKLYI